MRKFLTMCLGLAILAMAIPAQVFAQSGRYQVQGVVVDTTGTPVIGASVVEQGTTNGVTTDVNGQFSLNVSNAEAVVTVSFIGYVSQSYAANSTELQRVVLAEDSAMIDDIVVIGYGTVKKEDMTGSVVAIKAEDLNRGAVNSPDQLLMGKVPGLLVTPASGEPGTGAQIRIRGNASLNASNDPLIVIDGVPVTGDGGAGMGNPLASVNPDDIDTYTVLKDASATAIYGSRASNGVIIITTKKGKGKDLQVSYNSSYTVKTNSNQIDVLSGKEYYDYITNEYSKVAPAADIEKIQSLMGYNGTIYDTNWQDLIYRTAFSTDHAISVYGNTEDGNFPYRVSVGANYDQGTVKGGDNTRVNLGVNLSPKFLKDHLSVNVNLKGIYNKSNWTNNAVGDALSFDPTKPVWFYNEDGSINRETANGYFNWGNFDDNGFSPNTNSNVNPLSTLNDYVNYSHTWRSIGNAQIDYKVHGLEDLRFNLNLGYDIAESEGTQYNTIGSFNNIKSGAKDMYKNYTNYNANTLLEFYANYNKSFGDHRLDIMAGYSWQRNYVRYKSIGYYNNDREKLHSDYESVESRMAVPKEYYLISFFGRINYSIGSRYLFTVTVREDATSRFSKRNRWGFFPSAAFAWNIAEETFLEDQDVLSTLKLRLGWGETGQQDIGDDYYPHIPTYKYYNVGAMQYLPGVEGLLAPLAFNKDIKWETTTTYNAGIDFGFLEGRIRGSVDYYYRQTRDLLSDVSIPLGSNFTNSLKSNIGNMENQGVEVALDFVPIQTQDWTWSVGINGTWQHTIISDLGGNMVKVGEGLSGTGGNSSVHIEGYAPYTFYLYQQAYDADGKPLMNTFVDRNEDGRITEDDKYITGRSATPDFYYGINMQLTYKNWDFGFNGHGSIGNYAINKLAVDNSSTYCGTLAYNYLRNLNENHFRTGFTGNTTTEQAYSDLFIENASFFRLDDVNLGYTFRNIGKSDVNIRVAASVQNVCTISKFSGLDPEDGDPDGVYGTMIPRPRLYTLRLNINF